MSAGERSGECRSSFLLINEGISQGSVKGLRLASAKMQGLVIARWPTGFGSAPKSSTPKASKRDVQLRCIGVIYIDHMTHWDALSDWCPSQVSTKSLALNTKQLLFLKSPKRLPPSHDTHDSVSVI